MRICEAQFLRAGSMEICVLASFAEKLRGLQVRGRPVPVVQLACCSSVHTFGMRYPIDLAFLASDGRVLRTERAVKPARVVSCPGSVSVLERPACSDKWPEVEDQLMRRIPRAHHNSLEKG